MRFAKQKAEETGSRLVMTENLEEAVANADIIYASTWHSIGDEPFG